MSIAAIIEPVSESYFDMNDIVLACSVAIVGDTVNMKQKIWGDFDMKLSRKLIIFMLLILGACQFEDPPLPTLVS